MEFTIRYEVDESVPVDERLSPPYWDDGLLPNLLQIALDESASKVRCTVGAGEETPDGLKYEYRGGGIVPLRWGTSILDQQNMSVASDDVFDPVIIREGDVSVHSQDRFEYTETITDLRANPPKVTTTTLQNCTLVGADTFNLWIEQPGKGLRLFGCILADGANIGLAFELPGIGLRSRQMFPRLTLMAGREFCPMTSAPLSSTSRGQSSNP